MKATSRGQDLVRAPEELAEILGFISQHLKEWNGSSFWKKRGGLLFAWDAREAGSEGVKISRDFLRPIQIAYIAYIDEQQLRRVATHEFHSSIY